MPAPRAVAADPRPSGVPGSTGSWKSAFPVALEGVAFAAPITVGATALLYLKIGPELMMPGIMAALLGMVLMHLATAASGRPMVYATRVMEASMMLGFLDQFIQKMPGWGLADTAPHRLMLVLAISLGCALLQPLLHLARLRRFARMLPAPVFSGFSTALAVTVLLSQIGVLRASLPLEGPWFLAIALLVLLVSITVQYFFPRWPAGVAGVAAGSIVALGIGSLDLHHYAQGTYGPLVSVLPVQLVHWRDLFAPGVATLSILNDVALASATLAVLVFLHAVVNEESVSQLDDAQPRPRDWWLVSLAGVGATLLGSTVQAPGIAATRAAVRVGPLKWQAMLLIAVLTGLTLASSMLSWVPPAAICGLLLFDAWSSFHRPSLGLLLQWMRGRHMALSVREDLATIVLVVVASVLFNMVIGMMLGVLAGLLLYAWRNGRRLARSVQNGAAARSNCARSSADMARLAEQAPHLRFVELEGALFFGAAGALLALLRGQCAPGNFLVVDWSHVISADSTVASTFARAVGEARAAGTQVAVSGLETAGSQVVETLHAAGVQVKVFPDADRALEWAETELIHAPEHSSIGDATSLQDALSLLRGLPAHQRDLVEPLFEQRFFRASETVFEAGSVDNELMVILQGSVDILVPSGAGRDVRLARIRRGGMLGELGFLDASPRAARAVATEDLLLGVLSRERFDTLAREWPEAGQCLIMNLALDLAFRLRRTNRLAVSHLR